MFIQSKNIFFVLVLLFGVCASLSLHAEINDGDRHDESIHDELLEILPLLFPRMNPSEGSDQQVIDSILDENKYNVQEPQEPKSVYEKSAEIVETTTSTDKQISGGVLKSAAVELVNKIIPNSFHVTGRLIPDYSAEDKITYRYSTRTTFLAMATTNYKVPLLDNNEDKELYVNVTPGRKVIGVCKFEMMLIHSKEQSSLLEFLTKSSSQSKEQSDIGSFSYYSAPMQLPEGKKLADTYLKEECGKYSILAQYMVEQEFRKIVIDFFAHHHPEAQCKLPRVSEVNPKGDKSCKEWFNNPLNVMGSVRRVTVPRCVQNTAGIPVCVVRAKEGNRCPLYKSQLVPGLKPSKDKKISVWSEGDFYCDKGLKCLPPNVKNLSEFKFKFLDNLTGVESTCRK